MLSVDSPPSRSESHPHLNSIHKFNSDAGGVCSSHSTVSWKKAEPEVRVLRLVPDLLLDYHTLAPRVWADASGDEMGVTVTVMICVHGLGALETVDSVIYP